MFLDSFLGWFSVDMGIDLGTCNTLVCVRGEGIVLNEPSVVAVKRGTNRVLNNGNAVGWSAKEMLGKTPGSISAIRPLKDGVISDFEITEAMLSYFIRKVNGRSRILGPRVVIAVPSGITAVEKRAVLDSAERAGARRVYLVEEPMAAGIGAGLPIVEPTASMIVDIGGGTTEVAMMSLADIASCESIRVAGDDMDEAIISHMKKTYNLTIGEQTAERIKIEIGSAAPVDEPTSIDVRGRDNVSGLPRKTVVTSDEVREALQEPCAAIIETVMRTLERAEPELAADLVDNGITLVGGGALLRGIDVLMSNATGLDVRIADDPMTAVARGTSIYLENLGEWKATMESDLDEF
ncbi:MAG: rod shape-determining protein [Phycisphaerales bacterium]|nr:rod shape-determining protein [Planctomycetota bacterium]MCZ6542211.1 rod shape-determining protein [Planctomycetota bacterium]MCZ6611183.1 rod shape-determining protein [Planctomycetota bacterium]MCZ6811144.1 rod shape-determining protein [Planctomycetota bacterium]MCZ6850786.1 rod shape-determining protein [Planctomycetota bacterium]